MESWGPCFPSTSFPFPSVPKSFPWCLQNSAQIFSCLFPSHLWSHLFNSINLLSVSTCPHLKFGTYHKKLYRLISQLNCELPENKNSLLYLWKPVLCVSARQSRCFAKVSWTSKWMDEDNEDQIGLCMLKVSVNHKMLQTLFLTQTGETSQGKMNGGCDS